MNLFATLYYFIYKKIVSKFEENFTLFLFVIFRTILSLVEYAAE